MGRKRTKNKHLPQRWHVEHGAIFYRVPPGQEAKWDGKTKFRLGKTEAEAYAVWAQRAESESKDIYTVGQLLDRYLLEHTPTLSQASQRNHRNQIPHLRAYFGEMRIEDVEPHHVYSFMRLRATASKRGPALGKQILSHAYNKAREWGITRMANPCAGIRTKAAKSDRYVEDWEAQAMYSVCNPTLRAFMNVALITGQRKKDILETKLMETKRPEGLRVVCSKTGKKILLSWTPELRAAIDQAKAVKRKVGSVYLFATRKGECYMDEKAQSSGFDSMWDRAMKKALKETELQEPFTMNALRAKAASDTGELHAHRLLSHSTMAQTKTYRRKGDVVNPGKGSKLG